MGLMFTRRTPEVVAAEMEAAAIGKFPALDCQSCGACCVGWGSIGSVPVEAGVSNKYVHAPYRYFNPDTGEPYETQSVKIRKRGSRCAALCGAVGKKVSCAIYEHRPKACREFQPGSNACLNARAKKGITTENHIERIEANDLAYREWLATLDRTGYANLHQNPLGG